MRGPLLNFEGGAGVPLLYFEVGPGVPLLNFRGVHGPEVTFPGVLVPLLHHTVKNIFLLDLQTLTIETILLYVFD